MFTIAICDDDIRYIGYLKTLLAKLKFDKTNCTFLEYHSSVEFNKDLNCTPCQGHF